MENNNLDSEKKANRPRIGSFHSQSGLENGENGGRYEKVNYPNDPRSAGGERRPRIHNQQGNYGNYQQDRQNGYQNRGYGNYERQGYQPNYNQGGSSNVTGENQVSDSASLRENETDFQQDGGYQPRQNYQSGYVSRQDYQPRQGGYVRQNRGYNQNQQGGYGNMNRQGGYRQNNQGGYGNMNRQGGYRQNNQGGYGNMNRQGGYRQNNQGGYSNMNRQGGYRQNNQGGYGNMNRQGGYRQNNQGGYGNMNRPGNYRQNNYKFMPRPRQVDYVLEDIDPNGEIRLNKYMANAGLCSRREADDFITNGKVKVNGEVVTELGTKIKRNDVVEFDEKVVVPERKCYVLLNKPKDCVTTTDDPNGRMTVMDIVKNACNERIYPVGRLDRNTTGVLLLTNDGDLASKLTHPKFVKKKIYHVWTDKDISEEDMQKIADGIELEDGEIHADAISYVSETDRNQAGIEIHSGRNRIVRRIFESLGYKVTKLDRVYFAGLTKKNLPRGRWRYLTQEEVNTLRLGRFE